MPDILVEVRDGWLKATKVNFIEAIQSSVVTALQTPEDDKVVRLIEHAPDNFLSPRWAGEHFTHIEITLFKGRSLDTKRALYRAIVNHLEPFGVPPNDVKIILIEVQPSEVGMRGGKAVSELDLGYEITR